MTISLVVAAAENNVIGKDNRLLWHLPNDMAYFKNTTWGMPVIMGRKTFESLKQPLRGRTNIIISRNPGYISPTNTLVQASSLQDALAAAEQTDANECFVIGGGEIFNESIGLANRIHLTRVHAQLEGDVFFPEINESDWQVKHEKIYEADNKHAYAYTIQLWERKKSSP